MIDSYPLQWPLAYPRTKDADRVKSKFIQNMDKAQKQLRREVELLKGTNLVVSTNIPTRQDGLLFADWMRRKIDDPGVAIYFDRKKENTVLCCDQYTSVWENIYALAKGIEAMRGIERWGISDFINRAFTGFKELPAAGEKKPWWKILGISKEASIDQIKTAYKKRAVESHPDKGGTTDDFQEVVRAYEAGINEKQLKI